MKGRLGLLNHLGALSRRPSLLWEALTSFWEMRRHGRPHPSGAYLDWRLQTAYGTPNARVTTADLVHYLEWRRQMRLIRRWEASG